MGVHEQGKRRNWESTFIARSISPFRASLATEWGSDMGSDAWALGLGLEVKLDIKLIVVSNYIQNAISGFIETG